METLMVRDNKRVAAESIAQYCKRQNFGSDVDPDDIPIIHLSRSLPFRTLVVVPRSHTDGTFEKLCKGKSGGQVKCRDIKIASRAVQLDLRPRADSPHRSLLVAWDSRLVHQGHTHFPGQSLGWCPPLTKPEIFTTEDSISWRSHLNNEGYVALAHVLPEHDVRKALRLLLQDLQIFSPYLKCLDEVREYNLPPTPAANDLRDAAGLCHGRFAWFLRTHQAVARIFDQLFDLPSGTPLVGSVDVVALAPPDMSERSTPGKKWLHLDYSPPQGRIWQTTLQLFPDRHTDGFAWERIAVMICKAPAAWASPSCELSLLASCVTGAASRATAGVTLGLLHTEEKERRHYCGHRLLPELAATPLARAQFSEDGFLDSIDVQRRDGCELMHLRTLPVEIVMELLSLDDLRRLLPKHVLEYVSPKTAFDARASARTHKVLAPLRFNG